MEENNVTITIQSLQTLETGKESMTQRTEGRLCREGEGWSLTYREGEDSGLGRTRTTLRLEGGQMTLTRSGELTSHMVFQEGQSHTSLYETPYGKLPMTIRTLSLKSDLSRRGGTVSVQYQIQLGGGPAGETRLRLTIKAKENSYDR